ncbi:serine/threonine protein kinase with WD40 repeats [Thalassoporum mexicanum PCC 7367]|uniref:WD40 repeat domain-containing serine/threonine-protein kinase n=1 Tax=Thalassoporum mexicanum TaxID=3457544 RepID=UPI00029FECC2|nr:WD40 repeat domain-containing serine/threonine-protein kinase [Pseudanabaena sp. PCC 7367]AFY68445.1 serine/threonine protein kinase with WD40 repeats [Pseudanabaena sp. PCC 7367]
MPTVPLLMLGERLHERYEVTEVLETNRYGQTCIAKDAAQAGEPLCRIKVFKTLDRDLISLENARKLFAAEAQTLQELGDQNDKLPRLIDYFEQGGEFYLVEEIIPGESIAAHLRPGDPWSEQDVLLMLGDVLTTLKFVHNHQVVHGDINPQNIWQPGDESKFHLANFSLLQKITNSIWQERDRPMPSSKPNLAQSLGTSSLNLDPGSQQNQPGDNNPARAENVQTSNRSKDNKAIDLDDSGFSFSDFELTDLDSAQSSADKSEVRVNAQSQAEQNDREAANNNGIDLDPALDSDLDNGDPNAAKRNSLGIALIANEIGNTNHSATNPRITSDRQLENLTAIGTPSYMPVEQAQEKLQPSFDLYALGITAIQLLTGMHPSRFRYDNKNKEILWQDRSNASYELEEILERMVSADPNLRYGNAESVLADLAPLLKPISPTEITKPALPQLSGLLWRPLALLLLGLALISGGIYVFEPLLSRLRQINITLPRSPFPSTPQPTDLPNPPTDPNNQNNQTQPAFTELQLQTTLIGHAGWVRAVAFLANGNVLVSGSYDRTLRLWSLNEVEAYEVMSKHLGFSSGVNTIATSPDGYTIASGNLDKSIRFWDARSSEPTFVLNGHAGQVLDLDFDPTGLILASASADRTVKLWSLENHENTFTFAGHDAEVTAIAISPDGQTVISGDRNRTIKLWDLNTGQEIRSWQHSAPVRAIAISPDGQTIASGAQDGTIKLWDRQSGQEIMTLTGHTDAVATIAFDRNGQVLASGSHDRTIKLWQPATGNQLQTLSAHQAAVLSLDFNPVDHTLVSSSADKTIMVWQ